MTNAKRRPKSHLIQEERYTIQSFLQTGIHSKREIARLLGVNHSTVIRETQRNVETKGYDAGKAHKKSIVRRKKASSTQKRCVGLLKARVENELKNNKASPEQIAGRLKMEGHKISALTIYRYIYKNRKRGGKLYKQLRHGGRKYRKKNMNKPAGSTLIQNRIDISLRPEIVNKKIRPRDWEVDTVFGKNREGVVVSIVDRTTKYSIFMLVTRSTATEVAQAICDGLLPFARQKLVATITADNGLEFNHHQEITKKLGGSFYFARPYCSSDRGLNEHINGLLRQYLPKRSSFSTITQQDLDCIAYQLNNRPRKILNYLTPTEKLNLFLTSKSGGAFHL